jgi:hypothetical protein
MCHAHYRGIWLVLEVLAIGGTPFFAKVQKFFAKLRKFHENWKNGGDCVGSTAAFIMKNGGISLLVLDLMLCHIVYY